MARTQPGFLLELVAGPLTTTLGYKVEFLNYFTLTGLDATHQSVLFDTTWDSPAGLKVEVREDYVTTSDPQTSEQTARLHVMTNRARGEAEYRLADRWSVGADYTHTLVEYHNGANELDRQETVMGATAFWRFQPKTALLLKYSFGLKHFDEDTGRDVTRHIIEAGLRGDLTSRLSSTFRLGFEDRQPKDDSIQGYRGLTTGGDWTFVMFERTRLVLAADRRAEESSSANNAFFLTSQATLRLEHDFGPKVKANLSLRRGQNDYFRKAEDVDGEWRWRQDAFTGWGAGVTYDIQQWLQVGLTYTFLERSSNFSRGSYETHRIGGTLILQF